MSSPCPDGPQRPHKSSSSFLNGCLSCGSWPLHFTIVTPCLSKHLYTQQFTICKRLLSPLSYLSLFTPGIQARLSITPLEIREQRLGDEIACCLPCLGGKLLPLSPSANWEGGCSCGEEEVYKHTFLNHELTFPVSH